MESNNVAARAGRWSARHWKTATLGWLAFVAGFRGGSSEVVLVQSATAPAGGLRHVVEQTVAALSATPGVRDVRSPYARGNADQISEDGRSAVIPFELNESNEEYDGVARTLSTVAGVQRALPGFRIEETGGASIDKAVDETEGKDLKRAELSSIPLTIGILFVAFGALLAAFLAADVTAPKVKAAVEQLRERAVASGAAHEPTDVDVNPAKTVGVVSIPLAGGGAGDARSEQALATLERIARTTIEPTGAEAAVGGEVAGSRDFNGALKSHIPLVFGFVLGLAFLLLLVPFRSLVIALTAIVLNLLSVAAAYGLLVIVFQHGVGESLLGFHSTGSIVAWLPLFLFVVLFGLSMDYHVFILSRIREAYDRGLSTDEAVAHGIRSTAGVVTAAATVMVFVFAIFATLSQLSLKQLGVGLAAAVLIDATLIRAVLLPATMKLLGDANWYLPRRLRWLPLQPSIDSVT